MSSSHSCQFCQEGFSSRNALFRHLRTTAECFQKASNQNGTLQSAPSIPLPKQKIGIRFGYRYPATNATSGDASSTNNTTTTTTKDIPFYEHAAQRVQQVFLEALQKHQPVSFDEDGPLTQATVARLRHVVLAQDDDCSAASDVVGFHYRGEELHTAMATSIRHEMQQLLDNNTWSSSSSSIRVLHVASLPMTTKFQAEQSCTQRIYHYLLPMEWLQGGEDVQQWWIQKPNQQHNPRAYQRRPAVLKRLKQALQALESRTLAEKRKPEEQHPEEQPEEPPVEPPPPQPEEKQPEHGRSTMIASPGRYGSLWQKERRCFHNFCHLGGNLASPSHDPVWRTVDRAKVMGFVASDNNENVNAVVEIRGDGFVTQQLRRMMGAVVAMTNGWLPIDDYVRMATRPDVCLETPLAPPQRLYFSAGRFHFMELLLHGGKKNNQNSMQLFEESTPVAQEWQRQLQLDMIRQASSSAQEQEWLQELQQVVAPRIRAQMERIQTEDQERLQKVQQQQQQHHAFHGDHTTVRNNQPPPGPYIETVSLLRNIVKQEQWPRTSKARSRVIRSVVGAEDATPTITTTARTTTSSKFAGERFQSGSFTVVNSELYDRKLPLGNQLFPELAKAVFDLEVALATPGLANGTIRAEGERPPSSHCAINRNAEFTPHVDSGRGRGQSVSMIVGLGDYDGGAIFVEGEDYGIRYNPLEFDGWKQRHWTAPFVGERFSLVWFTPAGNDDESDATTAATENVGESSASIGASSPEDSKAQLLIQEHQQQLPLFPPFKYRPGSTDTLAIIEMFDPDKGCAYELKNHVWGQSGTSTKDFSPKGHQCVLDVGAHIGTFSRFALSLGIPKVIAYEPEPGNAELLAHNLQPTESDENESKDNSRVEIHIAAVAHGASGYKTLVHARSRNDGTINTWRHALEDYSQYMDKSTKLPSKKQENILTRSRVLSVPFFGNALTPGVTFVKMDCEGAELDILLSEAASKPESWLDVTHFVFEWSFTKEKRVQTFHKAIGNLQVAGFQVWYDGKGAWWDTSSDPSTMWPFRSDLVVFAMR